MKKYVLGFMVSPETNEVALIRKNHPYEQLNKLNGIGGGVKPNETFLDAMIREFEEETGYLQKEWNFVGMHTDNPDNYLMAVYMVEGDVSQLVTKTSEPIEIYDINDVLNMDDDDLVVDVKEMIDQITG